VAELALDVLSWWKGQQAGLQSPYLFPSPKDQNKPLRSVKTAWRNTLRRAGIPYFPIYQLRHGFCTRVSKVAADGVIQKAMRHSSPETKRIYQLGMVEEVRKAIEHGNDKFYGDLAYHIFSTVTSETRQPRGEVSMQVTGK
jgi:integrase